MTTLSVHRLSPGLRRVFGAVALAATLPLAACSTGSPAESPTSSAPSETASQTGSAAAELDPTGRWSSPEAGDPFLEFADDGTLTGSDGCNRIQTSWTLDGDTIVIESFTSTQKACAGVDAWLSKAATATVEGDVMTVKDGQGSVIGGLEKDK
ncbi:META domain-containing protein [Brevibacterium sp. XM4083]|uniref:META domain-containing protein n=1 Tax=Brevibacterium sp. XM4083 TaxID=2583238 RepID=UPI00112AD0D4|nr:META domain-containing protein [Brevibacterium sp. XM4083]MCM1014202.1 META domain-containing protein [Brevibacterium sp. XM4083]